VWFLCRQKDNPLSAVAIGIGMVGRDVVVQTARAVAFETGLSRERNQLWVESTARLLNEPFDTRKLGAVKKILSRKVPGRPTRGTATKRVKTR